MQPMRMLTLAEATRYFIVTQPVPATDPVICAPTPPQPSTMVVIDLPLRSSGHPRGSTVLLNSFFTCKLTSAGRKGHT